MACIREVTRLLPAFAAERTVTAGAVSKQQLRLLPQSTMGFIGQCKKQLADIQASRKVVSQTGALGSALPAVAV
jgi:hypothetical protein